MKRLLSYDPYSDISTVYHSNPGGKQFTIQTYQDVSCYLRANAEQRKSVSRGWKGDLHEVASIPPNVWNMWWQELGDNPGHPRNKAWLAAKLNSNEFLKLRTKEGKM